jgi:hypothetical protein
MKTKTLTLFFLGLALILMGACNEAEIGQLNADIAGATDDPGTEGPGGNGGSDPTSNQLVWKQFDYIQTGVTVLPSIDLLFIVDNSASMQNEQQTMADNALLFINNFLAVGAQFTFRAITTDSRQSPNNNSLWSGTEIIQGVQLDQDDFIQNSQAALAAFQLAMKPGTNGSSAEAGLNTFVQNLQAETLHLIPDNPLHVVAITDEAESTLIDSLNLNILGPGSTVNDYFNYINLYKSNQNNGVSPGVYFHHVGNIANISTYQTQNLAMQSLASSTSGLFLDILSNWGVQLAALAQTIIQLSSSILCPEPIDGGIKMFINNIEIPSGANSWTYNWMQNIVQIHDPLLVPIGTTVTIQYQVEE